MQEKIAQMTKMVISLTKGKGITDDPSLQREPTSWKGDIVPSIEPNSDNLCEQGRLKKDLFGWSHHVDMHQRCNLLNKKLKEIEGMDDLESVDPRELCLVPDVVIPPSSKYQSLKNTMKPNALRTIWPHIVTRWRGTLVMKICWSMCSTTVWLEQQLNSIDD